MPLLPHADPSEPFHIVLYPTQWAVSATVCQLSDGLLRPIRFCGRTLKGTESRYDPWALEVLALLRALRTCFYELSGAPLKVYTQFPVLQWVSSSKKSRAEFINWSVLLAPCDIEYISIAAEDARLRFSALLTVSMVSKYWRN